MEASGSRKLPVLSENYDDQRILKYLTILPVTEFFDIPGIAVNSGSKAVPTEIRTRYGEYVSQVEWDQWQIFCKDLLCQIVVFNKAWLSRQFLHCFPTGLIKIRAAVAAVVLPQPTFREVLGTTWDFIGGEQVTGRIWTCQPGELCQVKPAAEYISFRRFSKKTENYCRIVLSGQPG